MMIVIFITYFHVIVGRVSAKISDQLGKFTSYSDLGEETFHHT